MLESSVKLTKDQCLGSIKAHQFGIWVSENLKVLGDFNRAKQGKLKERGMMITSESLCGKELYLLAQVEADTLPASHIDQDGLLQRMIQSLCY